jgi:WhiB family transcriptional regulator, redox-sensing transcriptional regulator
MTATVTPAHAVTTPPGTTYQTPPPDPPGLPTTAAETGPPVDPGRVGPCWPPVACQGMDHWPFFGPDNERAVSRARRITHAKAICASCAALVQCQVFAIRTGQASGIWGGLSEEERGHTAPVRVPPGRCGNPGVPLTSPLAARHVR